MNKQIKLKINDNKVQRICKDTELRKLVSYIGDINLTISSNRLDNLIKSIIGQLLSPKSANTIYQRLILISGEITTESLASLSDESLKEIGISRQKISYIRNLVFALNTNRVNLNKLDKLDNNEVIATLTQIKGIGKWTAEMFLIFSLGRMNVLSVGDIGLQRACKWLYKETDGAECLINKSTNWEPYFSVASLYLWESVNRGLIKNFNSIDDVI